MNTIISITTELLETLPQPIQRYMRWTGVVGHSWTNHVYLEQTGRFRMAPDKPWMPMRAVQTYNTNPPSFEWKARFKLFGLPLMRAHDRYQHGHGHMSGKLAGLITIFDVQGEKLDQGAQLRYLSEAIWFPIAFLGENMNWEPIDDHSARITMSDAGRHVSGVLHVDSDGRPINFTCQRYFMQGDDFSLEQWSTPMTHYAPMAGLNLPIRGAAQWKLKDGDFTYIELEITRVEYS
jgi:hypothetical protein